jgi:indolepyruvate ferredoxin oxidoreductase
MPGTFHLDADPSGFRHRTPAGVRNADLRPCARRAGARRFARADRGLERRLRRTRLNATAVFTICQVAPSTLTPPPVAFEHRRSGQAPGELISGLQAIVRLLLDQRQDDRDAGIASGGFVSGYPGSPLARLDIELRSRAADLRAAGIVFQPGLNEELAATAVWGSQLAHLRRNASVDGVLGMWFAKNPGLDRAADALRHANLCGVGPASGAVAVVGDDPACKSSTLPSAAERTLAGLLIPVLAPASVQDVLDLGRHALRLSRAAGLWCALKVVADVADASATVRDGGRLDPVRRLVEHTPTAHLLGAPAVQAERSLVERRLPAALAYAREHDLNRAVVKGGRDEIGVIASGAAYAELARALKELGLGAGELDALGVRLLKVGMPWPLDREAVCRFADGLRRVMVIEDKLPSLQTEVESALLRLRSAPQVLGKQDGEGRPLLASHGALDADQISLALARLLQGRLAEGTLATQRLRQLDGRDPIEPRAAPVRTPYFCSGCPHSTATATAPRTLVGAGIGCHVMLVQRQSERVGEVVGLTQMGGEGAQWIGISPFLQGEHFTQNIGDGTFHHSGSLALRAAVAAGVDVTYKLLYNDAVAMTGGQHVEGMMSVPALTRLLAAEGVARVVVTTDDPSRYRRLWRRSGSGPGRLAPGTKVYDRSKLPRLEGELAALPGVKVIVHDQACAAERRRLRRRGQLPEPPRRAWINERVCEGCGDCGRKSGCLSVEPVQTELGPKRRVDQESCNKDMSCLNGDCPSFLTVRPTAERPGLREPPPLPAPEPSSAHKAAIEAGLAPSCTVRMVGIGGTGVVSAARMLASAAQLEGLPASVLDQTGLSQKAGTVVSDVRVGEPAATDAAPRAGRESIDLLIGFDLLGAADPRQTAACDPRRTVAVLSTALGQTGEMAADPSVPPPDRDRLIDVLRGRVASTPVLADAPLVARRATGDSVHANLVLLGAAWQLGLLPVGWEALTAAVERSGAAVERNLAALGWGRAIVAAPEAVRELVGAPAPPQAPSLRALEQVRARRLPAQLHEPVARRFEDLLDHGGGRAGRRIATRYLDELERVAAAESERAPGQVELTSSVARQLHKLLAYKDEYEVARLHLLPEERARRERELGRGARWWLHLHPPLLRALGLSRKVRLGRCSLPLLYALRAARRLRGTPLDPFGRSEVRRLERALPGEYLAQVAQALPLLDPATHSQVVALSEQAGQIRGYEQIKLGNVQAWRTQSARLVEQLRLARRA